MTGRLFVPADVAARSVGADEVAAALAAALSRRDQGLRVRLPDVPEDLDHG